MQAHHKMILGFIISKSLYFFSGQAAAQAPNYEAIATPMGCSAITIDANYDSRFLQGNFKIYPSSDGWLVTSRKDLKSDFELHEPALVDELKRFVDLLKLRGTEVMLVYVPTRGLTTPEKMVNWSDNNHQKALNSFHRASQQFEQLGIHIPNWQTLNDGFSDYHYKRDIHWRPTGAKITAKLVANKLNDMGFAKIDQAPKFETRFNGVSGTDASVQAAVEELCNLELPVEHTKVYATSSLETELTDDSALFGDNEDPNIVLVGTSFSAIDKFNFNGFLQESSNIEITNYALSGGGDTGGWIELLKSADFQENPPELVIWEVPSYHTLADGHVGPTLAPLVYKGCEEQAPYLIKNDVRFKPGGQALEVLFSDGRETTASKNLVLDITLSEKAVSVLEATVWFGSGGHKTYRLKRNTRTTPDGRFVFELGNSHQYRDEVFIGLDIDEVMMENGKAATAEDIKTLTADVKMCKTPYPYENNLFAKQ